VNAQEDCVEIGWTFLERAYWGRAYNAELKALMLEHAFRFVARALFRIGANNHRSQRAVEKLGAQRKLPTNPDRDQTTVVYVLERARWTAPRARRT
jgi:RimJ/RimL family protein N-acetyltransferase